MNTKYFEIFSGHICSTHSEYQMFVFPVSNWKYFIPAAAMGWGWPRIFTPNLRRRPGFQVTTAPPPPLTELQPPTSAAARDFLILTLSHVPLLMSLRHSQIESHNLDFSISKSITLSILLAGSVRSSISPIVCCLCGWDATAHGRHIFETL